MKTSLHDAEVLKKRGRKKGYRKEGPSARDIAVKSGLVPKAKNAYAMFTSDEMKKDRYVGLAWPTCSKQVSKAWKDLGEAGQKRIRNEQSRNSWISIRP